MTRTGTPQDTFSVGQRVLLEGTPGDFIIMSIDAKANEAQLQSCLDDIEPIIARLQSLHTKE